MHTLNKPFRHVLLILTHILKPWLNCIAWPERTFAGDSPGAVRALGTFFNSHITSKSIPLESNAPHLFTSLSVHQFRGQVNLFIQSFITTGALSRGHQRERTWEQYIISNLLRYIKAQTYWTKYKLQTIVGMYGKTLYEGTGSWPREGLSEHTITVY